MKKVNILWIILDLLFLIIFNVLFFVVGGVDHVASEWISFVFIHIAFGLMIATPFLIRGGKGFTVFGVSVYSIASAYFFIELIVGAIFILIAPQSYKSTLVIQLIITALYGVVLVANMIVEERKK